MSDGGKGGPCGCSRPTPLACALPSLPPVTLRPALTVPSHTSLPSCTHLLLRLVQMNFDNMSELITKDGGMGIKSFWIALGVAAVLMILLLWRIAFFRQLSY